MPNEADCVPQALNLCARRKSYAAEPLTDTEIPALRAAECVLAISSPVTR